MTPLTTAGTKTRRVIRAGGARAECAMTVVLLQLQLATHSAVARGRQFCRAIKLRAILVGVTLV